MVEQRAGYIVLTLEFSKEGRKWVGVCRELSTSTFAPTLDATVSELKELVLLHLNALEDAGECDRFLKESGVEFYPKQPPSVVKRTIQVGPIGKDCLTQPFVQRLGSRHPSNGHGTRRLTHA